jgi:CRP-like cAMP-binding protein
VADTVFYIQKGWVKVVVISEQGKEAVVGILETGYDPGSVGILSGRALVSLRFSPGSPVGEPLNEPDSNELSLMPNRKSPSTGPMSVQPIEYSSTAPTQQLAMVPTVGEQQRTPLPKDQQARADAVRTANARIMRRNSLWKQRLALKR